MTESEWVVSNDPKAMLQALAGHATDRKLRLFANACCHRVMSHIADDRSRAAVEFAERHADTGVARRKGRPAIHRAAKAAWQEAYMKMFEITDPVEHARHMAEVTAAEAAAVALDSNARWSAEYAAGFSSIARGWRLLASSGVTSREFDQAARRPEEEQQAHLLREVFGNPFRPRTVHPSWRSSNVVSLTLVTYQEGTFEQLPVLADALLDAGCSDEDLMDHFRGPGLHVRGCWALDLVLAKK